MDFYIYAYLDTRKPGNYCYGDLRFDFEPIYIGKGKKSRMFAHVKKARLLVEKNQSSDSIFLRKLKSMLSNGVEPTIVQVAAMLDEQSAFAMEKETIATIGRFLESNGPLLNVAEGGSGGITWVGEHPCLGKTLEGMYGAETANKMKEILRATAKNTIAMNKTPIGRLGYSANLGRIKGAKPAEEKLKISESMKAYVARLDEDERVALHEKRQSRKDSRPEEEKQIWYQRISDANKGREFSEDHKQKLKDTHYKKLNKGNLPETSAETKQKLSEAMKGRVFSLEHRAKLTKCIRYVEWKGTMKSLLQAGKFKTITSYRLYAKANPELRLPVTPEKSYRNEGWEGFKEIFNVKI